MTTPPPLPVTDEELDAAGRAYLRGSHARNVNWAGLRAALAADRAHVAAAHHAEHTRLAIALDDARGALTLARHERDQWRRRAGEMASQADARSGATNDPDATTPHPGGHDEAR